VRATRDEIARRVANLVTELERGSEPGDDDTLKRAAYAVPRIRA
jgi:hypothetical protein